MSFVLPLKLTQGKHDTMSCDTGALKNATVAAALVNITDVFCAPIEADLTSILDGIEDMVGLILGSDVIVIRESGTSCTDHRYCDILLVSELLFSLPFSATRVERFFFDFEDYQK